MKPYSHLSAPQLLPVLPIQGGAHATREPSSVPRHQRHWPGRHPGHPDAARTWASNGRSPISAGTTSRRPGQEAGRRSPSASPRTPASSSRSTTSRTPSSRPSTPPRSRRRPATTWSRCACTSRGSTSPSWSTSPISWPSSRRSTARPLLRVRGRPRQGRVARRAHVPWHLRADLPRGPLQEGQPQGAGHLGGPLHGRQGAEEDGAPGGDPHQPELRHDLHGRARAVVVRRHGGRQGRQDGPDQLAGHRADARVVPEDVPGLHGAGSAVLVRRQQQRVDPAGQGRLDPQPGQRLHRGQAAQAADRRRHQPPPEPGRAGRAPRDRRRRAPSASGSSARTSEPAKEWIRYLLGKREIVRRVHHVRRRLQPAGLREAAGPSRAQDRSEVRRTWWREGVQYHAYGWPAPATRQGPAHHQLVHPAQHDRQGGHRARPPRTPWRGRRTR